MLGPSARAMDRGLGMGGEEPEHTMNSKSSHSSQNNGIPVSCMKTTRTTTLKAGLADDQW